MYFDRDAPRASNGVRVNDPTSDRPDEPELVEALRAFADGGDAPADVVLQHVSTSTQQVTTATRVSFTGRVEVYDVDHKRPRVYGKVPIGEVRAAAVLLLGAGFPNVRPPKTPPVKPPPSGSSSVVRMAVARDARAAVAELPTSRIAEVRPFAQAALAVAGFGDAARKSRMATHQALLAMKGGLPSNVTVEASFFPEPDRTSSVEITPQGMVVETELRNGRRRRSALGPALPKERMAIAKILLDGAFPEGHGAAMQVDGPRYTLRVGDEEGGVEVVVAAEALKSEGAANRVVRALYSVAARLGGRPRE